MPYRLESQSDYLESNPGCALLSGHSEYVDRHGNALYIHKLPLADEAIRSGLPYSCQIIHPAVMFRRDHFLQTTGFLEQYSNAAFEVLLWNQFARLGFFANLNLVLIKYRIRPGSLTGISRFEARRKRLILGKLINDRSLSSGDVAFLKSLQEETPTKREARYLWRLGMIHKGMNNFHAARTCLRASLHQRFTALTLYHYLTVLIANKSNHRARSLHGAP